jgi:hypothetical protein
VLCEVVGGHEGEDMGQSKLIAHTLEHFGAYLLEKARATEGDTTH